MRSCNESKTLHCVESYLYYIILVNKKNIFGGVKRGREKNRPYIPVSQRVEINYIFSDNVRILYLSCYFKSPKETVKLSEKSRNKRCSYRF